MKSDYYVYCYFRPTGEPCYIGKGRGRRWKRHLAKSNNPHLSSIIAKAKGNIPYVKLCVGLSEQRAFDYENAWIKAIGREPDGPLVNLTAGGEGTSGHKNTEKWYTAIKAALAGKPKTEEHRAKAAAARKGIKLSDQAIENMRAAHKGKKKPPRTPEHRAKLGVSRRGKSVSQEQLKKMKTNCVHPHTEETRAQMKESQKLRRIRESQIDPHIGLLSSPSTSSSEIAHTAASSLSGL